MSDKVFECELTILELLNKPMHIPMEIYIRLELNKKGFKFEDDNKPSLILNRNPEPMGEFYMYEDYATGSRHFKQKLTTA